MFITTGTKSDYDKHIVAPNREWSAKFQYYYNGYWNSLGITSVQSFQLSDYSTDGSNISIGTVIGGKLDCKLMRISESVTSRLNRGTPIKISLTLNSSKATSSVTMASAVFVIDESKLTLRKSGGTYDISITAYDFSYTLTNKYIASSQSLSAIEILNEIGSKCGFTLGESVSSAISEFEDVSGGETKYTPLEDMTHKQTIGYMAGCYGCFAYFDNNLKLQFGWYESNGDTIKADRVFNGNSYIAEMEQRTIAMLETGTNSNPIVVPNNAKGFSINFENPYITQAQAEAVYNKRIADGKITFKIGKLSYKGSPLNNPRTIVTVKDVQNNGSPFYIMKRTLRYDGGLSETIECQGESEATINYKLTSPTQQRINRALSKMEEAIKNATDIITQTKGSVFEFIPIDETNPSLGNSGWKLYSTDIGKKNVILANSSGIGFSSNGGQSFNAAAIYIDENGVGHINANYIDVGEIDGSIIKAGTLVVGKNDIEGLDTELQALLDATNEADKKAGNAQTTADAAKSTANTAQTTANNASASASTALSTASTASTNASNALSVANSANGKIASWASANDTTLIDGAKIYTGSITAKQIESGSITADKLAIGLNNTNYAATEDWEGDTDYLSFSFDSNNSYKPKISMTFSATSFEKRLKLNKSFYVTAGSKLYCSAIAYADGTSNASNTYVSIGLSYSSSLNGDYSLSQYASSHNLSLKTEHKIGFDTTVNQSGYYRIEVWFNKCNNKAYLKDIFVAQGIPGEIVVNGKISSVDGKTYFNLDNSIIKTVSSNYQTEMSGGSLKFNNSTDVLYGGLQIGKLSSKDSAVNANVWYYTDESEGISIGKKDSGDLIIPMFSVDDSGVVFNSTTTSTTFYSNAVIFNSLIEFNKNVDCYGKFTVDTVILKNNGGIKGQYTSGETTDDHLIGKINENDTVVLGWHSPKVSINVSEKEVAFWNSKTYCLQNGINTIQITPTNNTGISETSSRYIVGDFTTNGEKIVRRLRFSPYHSDGSYGVSIDDDTNAGTVWFRPTADNYLTLGSASYKWKNIYAYTSAIGTSDKTMKRDIKNIESNYEEIFYSLKPVSFKFIDGKRTHLGFIAQDVEEAMINAGLTPNDFAALCKDPINDNGDEMSCTEENYQNAANILYGLRYSEFIPLCVHMIQKLQNKVNELEEKLNDR